MAAPSEDAAQREHRRVGGQDDELVTGPNELEPAVERALEVGDDLDLRSLEPAVGEAKCELGGAAAGDDDAVEPGQERLEVDVPDPGHVSSVGDLVVERHDRNGW